MFKSKQRLGFEDPGSVLLPNESTHRYLFSDKCYKFECMLSVIIFISLIFHENEKNMIL